MRIKERIEWGYILIGVLAQQALLLGVSILLNEKIG